MFRIFLIYLIPILRLLDQLFQMNLVTNNIVITISGVSVKRMETILQIMKD